MRNRAVVGLALVVSALLSSASFAATDTQTWTVSSASGARSAPLRLTSAMDLKLAQTQAEIANGNKTASSVIHTEGRFGGMLIRDAAGNVWGGLLRYAGAAGLVSWGRTNDAGEHVLPAGMYTATVFGDRAVRITLPVSGDVKRKIVATRPVKAAFSDQHDADALQGMVPAADFNAPMTVGPRTSYVVLGSIAGPLPGTGVGALCVTARSNPTCLGWAQAAIGGTGGCAVCSSRATDTAIFADPSAMIPSGSYTARYTVAEAGLSSNHSLFTAVFD